MRRLLFANSALVLAFAVLCGPALAQDACSRLYNRCTSACPVILEPPNRSGMRGLGFDQACIDRCIGQMGNCSGGANVEQQEREQRQSNERRRHEDEEAARASDMAAERRRNFEEEATHDREMRTQRSRLDREQEADSARRQRRDADTQLQQSYRNASGECTRICGVSQTGCQRQNAADANYQHCLRLGDECRTTCASNPAFLPRGFVAIQPSNDFRAKPFWADHSRQRRGEAELSEAEAADVNAPEPEMESDRETEDD